MKNNIFLEVNGIPYEGFTNINVIDSIEFASSSFRFTATSEGKEYLPFKGQEECRVMLNDTPLITGYIEQASYDWDDQSHVISVSGRDRTSDLIDSTLAGNIDIKAPISLVSVFYKVLSSIASENNLIQYKAPKSTFGQLTVSNTVSGLEDFNENEIVVGKVGMNAFEFLEQYCRKRAVLFTSDGNGNIVITRGGTDTLEGILINQLNGKNNNLLSGGISYDFSNRFNKYVVRSQGNPSVSEILSEMGLSSIDSVEGIAYDDAIRGTRVMEIQAETSSTTDSTQKRADWEANVRRARSYAYNCKVSNIYTNAVKTERYQKNKKIRVIDVFSDIDAMMLIQSIQYNISDVGGTDVSLTLVPPDAYTQQPSANATDAKYYKIGENVVES